MGLDTSTVVVLLLVLLFLGASLLILVDAMAAKKKGRPVNGIEFRDGLLGSAVCLGMAGLLFYFAVGEISASLAAERIVRSYKERRDLNAATSLVLDQSQPRDVVESLILRSEPDTEAILIEVMGKTSDTEIVKLLLNSQNPRLEEAARNWAAAHGYRIESIRATQGAPKWKEQDRK